MDQQTSSNGRCRTAFVFMAMLALSCAKAQSEQLGQFVDAALWEGSDNSGNGNQNMGQAGNPQSSGGQSTSGMGGSSTMPAAGSGGAGGEQGGAGGTMSQPMADAGQEIPVEDAGEEGPVTYLSDFSVAYQVEISGATSSYVGCQLQIWNFGFDSAPLSEFKIRYYYTNEIGMAAGIRINWGNVNNGGAAIQIPGSIMVTEHELQPPSLANGADYYLEFTFTGAEQITEGGKVTFSWQMDAPPQESYTQMGDYSFDPTKTTLTEWDRVVLYRNGQGAWGVEP